MNDPTLPKNGYVYILINPSLQQDYLKIGMTERSPEDRAREISQSTGVPTKYVVVYKEFVPDCHKAERLIHNQLDQHRLRNNREFFILPLDEAIPVVRGIAEIVRETYTPAHELQELPHPVDWKDDESLSFGTSIKSNSNFERVWLPIVITIFFFGAILFYNYMGFRAEKKKAVEFSQNIGKHYNDIVSSYEKNNAIQASKILELFKKYNKLNYKDVADYKIRVEIKILEAEVLKLPVFQFNKKLYIFKKLSSLDPSNTEYKEKIIFYQNKIKEKQNRIAAADNLKKEINSLEAQVSKIPISKFNKNLEIYQKLSSLDPSNSRYKRKIVFYQNKIKEKQSENSQKADSQPREIVKLLGFQEETMRVTKALNCTNPGIMPADSNSGALYSCITGSAKTVKFIINETKNTGKVENVKLIWNDRFLELGHGIHTDKMEAAKYVKVFASLYEPTAEKLLMSVFFSNMDTIMELNNKRIEYTYTRGLSIDERMLIFTPKSVLATQEQPRNDSAKK